MLMRIREAWAVESDVLDSGPVESYEFYVGGLRRNMGTKRRNGLGRHGVVSKTAVAGLKGRTTHHVMAKVIRSTNEETLQHFVIQRTEPEAMVYTDDSRAYSGLTRRHKSVMYSVGEYARGEASTNGFESF